MARKEALMIAEWSDKVLTFNQHMQHWREQTLAEVSRDQTWFLPSIIVDRSFDYSSLSAAWIVFAHLEIAEHFPDGRWQAGTFRHRVWFLSWEDDEPTMMYERTVDLTREINTIWSAWGFPHEIDRVVVDRFTVAVRDRPALEADEQDLSWVPNWLHLPRPGL